jgi:hypothetical protein
VFCESCPRSVDPVFVCFQLVSLGRVREQRDTFDSMEIHVCMGRVGCLVGWLSVCRYLDRSAEGSGQDGTYHASLHMMELHGLVSQNGGRAAAALLSGSQAKDSSGLKRGYQVHGALVHVRWY